MCLPFWNIRIGILGGGPFGTPGTRRCHSRPRHRCAALLALLILVSFVASGCTRTQDDLASNMAAARAAKKERKELRDAIRKIEPFFKPMAEPATSDWLAAYNEPGQTFDQYLDSDPTTPTTERHTIYILPLGSFNSKQKRVIDAAAGYLEIFYDLPVQTLPAQMLNAVGSNVRQNRTTRSRQVRTGYILIDVLKPTLPRDAAALTAFTADDLYPDETMNYVFGQASLADRVGVWSLARLDDNTGAPGFLRRTLKIAAHETGHMFSMRHCIKYECVMSGTNHLAETDRRPIDACPECTAKICWFSDTDQAARYKKLEEFCRKNGLTTEADEFARKSAAVEVGSD